MSRTTQKGLTSTVEACGLTRTPVEPSMTLNNSILISMRIDAMTLTRLWKVLEEQGIQCLNAGEVAREALWQMANILHSEPALPEEIMAFLTWTQQNATGQRTLQSARRVSSALEARMAMMRPSGSRAASSEPGVPVVEDNFMQGLATREAALQKRFGLHAGQDSETATPGSVDLE